ncbi:MAG: hypothetical protein PF501_07340 [Salinisphaera sp.]|nr:hypothetical protein [Salinisphaera sp.]
MKDEYDFSNGERGKFYRPNATYRIPLYLDSDVMEFLTTRAREQGIDTQDLANQMLKKDIEIVQAAERSTK